MRLTTTPKQQDLTPHENLIDELLSCLDPLEKIRFEQKLNGAIAVVPFDEAVQRILLPLQRQVGELWHEGLVTVAVEHYVTKVVQQKLFSVMNQLPMHEFGPRILVACPEGELHEIGAQAVAYVAATQGCQVYYLGPNLPSSALSSFCERMTPDLVLLSLTVSVSEEEARRLFHELAVLSEQWPVVMGGQGARALEPLLQEAKIELIDDLTKLQSRLRLLLSARFLPPR